GNRLAQLQGSFIELLSVTKPDDVPEAGPGEFSFGAYNRDYLKTGDGMSMLALTSDGWEVDRARFERAGFKLPAPFAFGRKARQPDGSEVKLDFRLTFLTDPALPRAPFFTCDHRHPGEIFWKPRYQAHANGARRIVEVQMVAENPEAHIGLFKRLFGAVVPINGGICAGLDGAGFCVLEPDAFAETYPGAQPPAVPEGEVRFAGFRVAVDDLDAAEDLWRKNGVTFRRVGWRIYVSGENAFGGLIVLSDS
ncbi:MAG TPA: VOC family protein, partial [Rhodospirillaceae bacterium]|nr:VOC family protein [Rhodospirillaceae bacterium]